MIGASTGGPDVLLDILGRLSRPILPAIIAQHMVADQTEAFARHLARGTGLPVTCRGMGPLPPGEAVTVLPGGSDWRLDRIGGELRVRPADVPGNHFHPSVDTLFASAASVGLKAGVVVLTGMGRDGAEGARLMADAGAPLLVQAPATCAVSGMPSAAMALSPAAEALAPASIAARIDRWAKAGSAA